jgi:hypothetical protein
MKTPDELLTEIQTAATQLAATGDDPLLPDIGRGILGHCRLAREHLARQRGDRELAERIRSTQPWWHVCEGHDSPREDGAD